MVPGRFTVHIPKQTRGEHFPDLDLQTLLLTPTRQQHPAQQQASTSLPNGSTAAAVAARSPRPPLIEVLSSSSTGDETTTDAAAAVAAGDTGEQEEVSASADAATGSDHGDGNFGSSSSSSNGKRGTSTGLRVGDLAVGGGLEEGQEPPLVLLPTPPGYGFDAKYSGILGPLVAELPGVVDLPQPDRCPPSERLMLCRADEESCFDEDYYVYAP